jgi:hypothetical protein
MTTNTTHSTQRSYNATVKSITKYPPKNYSLVSRIFKEKESMKYWEGEADRAYADGRMEYAAHATKHLHSAEGAMAAYLELAAARHLLTENGDVLPIFTATS